LSRFDLSTPGGRLKAYLDYTFVDHAFLRLGFQNAHWISEELVRTNQPWPHQLAGWKDKGIKTSINLRAEDNSEASVVEKLGMTYVQIPVDEVRPWTKIPDSAIAKYFEVVNNPANYPIFFHCRRGADRTGFFAALYRMALHHWDAKKAHNEARKIGMRWYYAGLKSQIYDFKPPSQAELQPSSGDRM